jgi:hypothetical protein
MTRAVPLRRTTFAAVVLLTLVGCHAADLSAPAQIVAPDGATTSHGVGPGGTGRRAPTPVACPAAEAATASVRIGPRGGVLRIAGSRLVVPPGSLRAGIRITAALRGDASGTIDFLPEGLRFQEPALLVLSAAGCEIPAAGIAAVVHIGMQGEILETIAASFDRRRDEVAAPITHFSGYAIAF